MRLLSIDIGTKNCAFYIEDFNEKDIIKLKRGTTSLIENLYKIGKRVFWKVVNFEKELRNGSEIFVPMIQFLDSNMKLWDSCNGIILEKQMPIIY